MIKSSKCPNCGEKYKNFNLVTFISLFLNIIMAIATIITAMSIPPDKVFQNIEFLVDCSETMNEEIGNEKRIDIFINAFEKLRLTNNDNLALRIFGGECNDEENTKLIVDFSTGNKSKIKNKLKSTKITGKKRTLVNGIIYAVSDYNDTSRFDKNVKKRIFVITSGKNDDECNMNSSHYQWRADDRDVKILFPEDISFEVIGIGIKDSDKKYLKTYDNNAYFVDNKKEIENVFRQKISKPKKNNRYNWILLSILFALIGFFNIYIFIKYNDFKLTKNHIIKVKEVITKSSSGFYNKSKTQSHIILQFVVNIIIYSIAIICFVIMIFVINNVINNMISYFSKVKQHEVSVKNKNVQQKKIYKFPVPKQDHTFPYKYKSNVIINHNKGTLYTIGDLSSCLNKDVFFSKYLFFIRNTEEEWNNLSKTLNLIYYRKKTNYKYFLFLEGCADKAQIPNDINFNTKKGFDNNNFNLSNGIEKYFNNEINDIFFFQMIESADCSYLNSIPEPKILSKKQILEGYSNYDLSFLRALFIKNMLIRNNLSLPIAIIEGKISEIQNHRTVILYLFETETDFQMEHFKFYTYDKYFTH